MPLHRRAIALMAISSALLAACGNPSSAGSGPSSPAAGRTALRVAILPGFVANATPVRYTLRCGPPTGDVPDPTAACRRLFAQPAVLAVRSRCFLPDTGANVVTGEFAGRRVNLRLGNCDPDATAWARLAAALGVPPRAR